MYVYRKELHMEFLDHNVLVALKRYIELLPGKQLPNLNIRTTVLTLLLQVGGRHMILLLTSSLMSSCQW